ncbi:MAG TPA: hypothetical protein VF145_13595 [Chitinophagaceae bacterium]
MKLSRRNFWIVLHLSVLLLFLAWQLLWLVAGVKTEAVVTGFSEPSKDLPVVFMFVEYNSGSFIHQTSFIYDQDVHGYRTGEVIEISYLSFAAGSSRLPGFTAGDAVAAMSYALVLFVTGLIFLIPNYLVGKYSYFVISGSFPFVKHHNEKPITHWETVNRIVRANLVAGYVEKFMFPFVVSAVAALLLYLFTWSVTVVVLSFICGIVSGIIRAVRWKQSLQPGDDELEVLDVLHNSDDKEGY